MSLGTWAIIEVTLLNGWNRVFPHTMQKVVGFSAQLLSTVCVGNTCFLSFCRFVAAMDHIVTRICGGHNGSHNYQIKLFMSEKYSLSSKISVTLCRKQITARSSNMDSSISSSIVGGDCEESSIRRPGHILIKVLTY